SSVSLLIPRAASVSSLCSRGKPFFSSSSSMPSTLLESSAATSPALCATLPPPCTCCIPCCMRGGKICISVRFPSRGGRVFSSCNLEYSCVSEVLVFLSSREGDVLSSCSQEYLG